MAILKSSYFLKARLFLVEACALFLLLLVSQTRAVAGDPGISSTEILLGQSAAFQGQSQRLGIELWRGAQSYFDELNAKGGVHGRKIRVLSLNDGYEGDQALLNTLDLITKKNVFALFGYVGTPTIVKALPAVQNFSSSGIFLFSNFTGAQPQREPPHSHYVINIRASYRQETAAIVDNLLKIGFKKIGVFIQDDAYGRSGADGVSRQLATHGLQTFAEATYKRGSPFTTSMTEQLQALKGADAIISIASYAAAAAFIRDSRTAGFSGPIANVSFVGPDPLLDLLVSASKDLKRDLTVKLINSQVVPLPTDMSVPLVKEYRATFKKFNPELPAELRDSEYKTREFGFVSLEGYLNAKVFVEILKRCPEPLTRKAFMNQAEHMSGVNVGLSEKVRMTPDDHQALHAVFFTTIKDGKYVNLQNWELFR